MHGKSLEDDASRLFCVKCGLALKLLYYTIYNFASKSFYDTNVKNIKNIKLFTSLLAKEFTQIRNFLFFDTHIILYLLVVFHHFITMLLLSSPTLTSGRGCVEMWLVELLVSVTAGVAIFIICKWLDRNNNDN